MILLRLFIEFFKIGLFAIGGGMATIPFLRQLSLSTGWFPPQLITDMIAISESKMCIRDSRPKAACCE